MRRMLTPREHGTYAQLAFPLLSGLVLGRPALASFGLVVAVVCLFLSYEPVAVLLGVRGVRLQRDEAAAARRQLVLLGPLALLVGVGALVATTPLARLLTLVPVGLGALLLPLVSARRVKSLAGETLVAGALGGMHLPVAAAGGVSGPALWGPALVWFAGFFAATLAVHAIKARQKQRGGFIVAAAHAVPMAGVALAVGVALLEPGLRLWSVALAVPVLAVLAVNAARVHPRSLKRVGWTLVGADTLTLLLLALL